MPIGNHGALGENFFVRFNQLLHKTSEVMLNPSLWNVRVQKATHDLTHETPHVDETMRDETFNAQKGLHSNQVVQ